MQHMHVALERGESMQTVQASREWSIHTMRREPTVPYTIRIPGELDARMFAMRSGETASSYIIRAIRAQVELDEAREREAAAHEAEQEGKGGT